MSHTVDPSLQGVEDGKRNERTRVMDGREVEEEIRKWAEEVITGCDQKRSRVEKQALKKRSSRSTDQQRRQRSL